jgi:hypothetical protein
MKDTIDKKIDFIVFSKKLYLGRDTATSFGLNMTDEVWQDNPN